MGGYVIIYVVTAYRWGDREKHSYVVGAYDNLVGAKARAKREERYRGGKYECGIAEIPLNEIMSDDEDDIMF